MTTYVYSLRAGARLAHIGNAAGTACGYVFTSSFAVSDNAPPDRSICARCAILAGARAQVTTARLDTAASRDAELVALLKAGLTDRAVARRLRLATRTMSRFVNDAMRRAGASSRFEWGYLVGLAEGCT